MQHERFSIVLVEPQESLNIGAAARAMKNLGFGALHLVKPQDFKPERAAITACSAADLVERAVVWESLAEVLAGHSDVIGFSGRAGKNRPGQLTLPGLPPALTGGKTALVFGPEDNGLSQEDAALCRLLVRIPSADEYTSYNLAQAVLLVLAELTRAEHAASQLEAEFDRPEWNQLMQLDRLFERVATKSGFYREGTPQPVPFLMQNLLKRMQPDKREMAILLGLFSRIERHIDYLTERKFSVAS